MLKNTIVKILCLSLVTILISSFVACGETDEKPSEASSQEVGTYGNQVGDLCFASDLETFDGGTVNITETRGKVTVINFWGEWCPWCLYELPDFDRVAADYENDVSMVAVHSVSGLEDGLDYAAENYPDTKMIFAKDENRGGYTYYSLLGGTGSYPRTIVLDRDGKIVFSQYGAMSYDALVSVIEEYI